MPKLVEAHSIVVPFVMKLPSCAISVEPSAEQITPPIEVYIGTVLDIQVAPPLVEVYSGEKEGCSALTPGAAATFSPSAEQATQIQVCAGGSVGVGPQVAPQLVETPMRYKDPPATYTTLPSADEAIEFHPTKGALVCVQVWAQMN